MKLFDDIDVFIPPKDDDLNSYEHDSDNNKLETESDKKRYYNKHNSHNLIYKKRCLAKKDSPECIYLPSKECIFKMMRACIGIFSIKDLWFN